MGRYYRVSGNLTRCVVLSCVGLTLFAVRAEGTPFADVRTVYLVPSDRTYNPEYEVGISIALTDLQDWYAGELGGPTFVLHAPVVEIYNTPHTSDYYSTNPNGPFFLWFWENTIADAFSLT